MEQIRKIIQSRIVISALWIVPFIVLGFHKNMLALQIIVAFLALLAIRELDNLDKKSNVNTFIRGVYVFTLTYLYTQQLNISYFNTNFVVMLVALIYVLNMLFNNQKLKEITFYLVFTFIIGYGLNSFIKVYQNDNIVWLYYLATIWVFDATSLIFGKIFGKRQLIKISPSKTVEGLIGGFISTIVIMVIIYFLAQKIGIEINMVGYKIFSILPLVCLASFVGDLLLSHVKREYQIKDFSRVLGTHGGILDRIDSQLIAFITISILI